MFSKMLTNNKCPVTKSFCNIFLFNSNILNVIIKVFLKIHLRTDAVLHGKVKHFQAKEGVLLYLLGLLQHTERD